MATYWVEFEDRAPGCVEPMSGYDGEPTENVLEVAGAFGKVKAVYLLPYPREPRLGKKSECPSFCYGKRECLGKTSCPKHYACSE